MSALPRLVVCSRVAPSALLRRSSSLVPLLLSCGAYGGGGGGVLRHVSSNTATQQRSNSSRPATVQQRRVQAARDEDGLFRSHNTRRQHDSQHASSSSSNMHASESTTAGLPILLARAAERLPALQPLLHTMYKHTMVRWVLGRGMALVMSQMTLELCATVVLGLLLWCEYVNVAQLRALLVRVGDPWHDRVAWQSAVYDDDVAVGPFRLKAQKLTAAHTAYVFVHHLLLVQFALVLTVTPLLRRCR